MKFSEKELIKVIQEELERVDEIFNIPFGKSAKSRRNRPTERGLSKEMGYDDFLDGLDKKGQAVFDSAASYSDMKDAKQGKQFNKMLKQHRDMLIKVYNKIMNDMKDLYPDPEEVEGSPYGDLPLDSTPDVRDAVTSSIHNTKIPGIETAVSKATGTRLSERKNRRRKRTK